MKTGPSDSPELRVEGMKDDGHDSGEYERDRKWPEDKKQKIGEEQNRRACYKGRCITTHWAPRLARCGIC